MKLLALIACVCFSGCSVTPLTSQGEPVPLELVPPGYKASECRLVKQERDSITSVGQALDIATGQRVECQRL